MFIPLFLRVGHYITYTVIHSGCFSASLQHFISEHVRNKVIAETSVIILPKIRLIRRYFPFKNFNLQNCPTV